MGFFSHLCNRVFPAYAGMSPYCWAVALTPHSFPRLRGDEPDYETVAQLVAAFSPPTRG